MPKISVTITPSFAQVGSMFQAIQMGAALQRAISVIAYQIERDSKKVTPVDTGRLRASIFTDIGNLRAVVAPHTEYAGFVHEGTRYMKARPFMMWGTDSALTTLEGVVAGKIEEEIKDKIK